MDAHPDNANLPVSNRPATILAVTITFLVVAISAVSLRLYVRCRERLWGWDDLFVFLAGVSAIVGASITCLMPANGLGKHFWTLDEHTVMEYFKGVWASNVTYVFSACVIKLAILFQYLRLFDMQSRVARNISRGLLCFTALWGTTFFLLSLFSCSPIAKNWNFKLQGKCVAWGSKDPSIFFASWAAHSASNMTLDVLVFLLPIPFLGQLRMGGRTRVGLIALFTMGGTVVSLAIARVIALCIRRVGTVPVFDPTFATPTVYIFSVLEINVAILCASIPIFWPLVSSLSANKILIVNEVEVRTERRSEAIALAEQGSGEAGFTGLPDIDKDDGGRTSRMSIMDAAHLHHGNSRLNRSASRRNHRSKPSTASSHRSIGLGLDFSGGVGRSSQDSQRNLKLAHQTSINSFSSSPPDVYHNGPLELSRSHSVARYHDKYMQDWAVPDFDKGAPGAGHSGPGNTFTTTVERAEIPYDHIKALEK